MKNIHIINPDALIKVLEKTECGKIKGGYITSADFESRFWETEPDEGYSPPEGFPDCCDFHRAAMKQAVDYFIEFPNCCDTHRKLLETDWFDKRNYQLLPKKIINTLSYTEYHIGKYIDAESWFQKITDYIEYSLRSFGQLPDAFGRTAVGAGIYTTYLTSMIESSREIEQAKKEAIVSFIVNHGKHETDKPRTDINLLMTTYRKWLKIFPFELSYFAHLKPQLENTYPILKGKPVTNPYLRQAKAEVSTYEDFLEFLFTQTKFILSSFNGLVFYETGNLNEVQQTSIEVLNAGRRLELKVLGERQIGGKKDFVKVIKAWFKGEKRYLAELSNTLKTDQKPLLASIKKPTKVEILGSELDAFGFWALEKCKVLPTESRSKLLELIAGSKMPYQIALLDFLGFIRHLELKHSTSKYKMYKDLARLLNEGRNERGIKAHISTLFKNSKEDRKKYTAHLHKEKVKIDYQKLI